MDPDRARGGLPVPPRGLRAARLKEGHSLRIRQRLTVSFILVAGLSTLVAGLFLNRTVAQHITDQINLDLEQKALRARDVLAGQPDLAAAADPLADQIGLDLSVRVTVIAADGNVLGDTDLDGDALAAAGNDGGKPEVSAALRLGHGRSVRTSATRAERILYVARRIDPADPARGIVRLAVPLTAVRRAQEKIRLSVVGAALLSILAAALFGWVAARRPARRLEEMAKTASDIATGGSGARADSSGKDEVAGLARSLNRMADQLEERLALLARERNQLRTVLDGMVEGVLLTDEKGTILLANRAFERIFDAIPPVQGRRPLETARIPELQEAVDAALEAAEPVTREIALGGARDKTILASLAAIRERERTVGAVAVFHDVTELKNLERVRREFVANVSHELRTPLTAICGYAETLRDGGLQDPRRSAEFVDVIHRHARRLQALIEDLLELSSIEQGQARLLIEPVALRDVAAQAEGVVRPAVSQKRQSLSIRIPEGLPPPLADRDRLAQVLINLLDNAVKFTPEGGRIAVSASAGDGRVVLSVSDTGIGLPAEEVGRVFERFYRVDRSRDRREGGTGLGLAIAKHLMQAMGGSIEVESTPGDGTTFRLSLPAA